MNFLNFILNDVKKYSEIVSKVINIDVKIMDSSFTTAAQVAVMVQVRVPPVHPVPSGAQFLTGMVVVPGA